MATPLGQPVTLSFRTFSDADRTTPADPTSVTVSVLDPAGDLTDLSGSVSNPSVGVYELLYQPAAAGHYEAHWVATGAVATAFDDAFDVRAAYSSYIRIEDVKARLNKALTVDDDEIADMIDAAEAEYAEHVGPLPGEVTETLNGGGTVLVLPHRNISEITAAAYSDGTAITLPDLDLNGPSGLLYWRYGTAGYFTAGSRNVTLTYRVGGLPANHREAIIADVAGYFATTQRGSAPADFPGEPGYEAAYVGMPQTLFPRIRALGAAYPSIA